nr:MAG TPA: hypothetical protein [Caudoviricetes sp.]
MYWTAGKKLHKARKCDRELTRLVREKTIESGSL